MNEYLVVFFNVFYIYNFFYPLRSIPLGSPIAREWLSSIANYLSSPCSQSGRGGAGSQTFDESPMGTPGSAHTGTDDFDTDLQEDEEYKSLEIKKGPYVYLCSLHTSLNFASQDEMHRHFDKHSKNHICDECSKQFASKHNLENHILKEHDGISTKFKCMVDGCTAVLYSRGGLYKHCNREHKCQFCNKVFMGPGEVDNHECKATTSALVCHFCKKEFCMAQTCKCHIEEVCLANPEVMVKKYPYKCDICRDCFSDKNKLSVHIDVSQKWGNRCVCQKCNCSIPMRDQANQHTKVYHS